MDASSDGAPLLHLRVLGDCAVVLWGLSSVERLRRQIRGAGVALAAATATPRPGDSVLVVRAEYLYDQRIIRNLVALRDVVLEAPAAAGPIAVAAHVDAAFADAAVQILSPSPIPTDSTPLRRISIDTLVDHYIAELLKSEAPLLLPIRAERRAEIERRLFDGSYKGVTDVVTKYVWPRPARWVTRFCVAAGIRPNYVTFLSIVLVCIASALFASGWLATGLVFAWCMTFLDTVDGKLARVTVDTTDLGHFMDKILDIVHPPVWYVAWGFGLSSSSALSPGQLSTLMAALLAGYIGGRLSEVLFRRLVGGFSLFSWRRFDSRFRLVLARRNPCLLILTAALLVGQPDEGLIAVVLWTVVSGVVLLVRVAQALHERLTVGPLQAWLRAGSGAITS